MTIRQLFYRLVSVHAIQNNRKDYQHVSRLMTKAREDGRCPFEWIVDRSRESYEISVFKNPRDYGEVVKHAYRRDNWQDQPYHVEVWTEKDAVTGSILPVQQELGVPIRPLRGFNSASKVKELAQHLASIDKVKVIFYLGDHDASGAAPNVGIQDEVRRRVLRYGSGDFRMTRIAILKSDIELFNLPPMQVKPTDSRAAAFRARFGEETVELDALPPKELRQRLRKAIVDVMDWKKWNRAIQTQEVEIRNITEIVGEWRFFGQRVQKDER